MPTAVIGALRAELSAGVARFATDMTAAGKEVDKLGKKFQRVGGDISRVGRNLSLSLTAPIVGFGALALRTAGDFEAGMNRVAAVSGATGDDLERLSDLAKEMGIQTQFSASESADAMGFLAMAGFEVDEIMGALPGTLQLAAAAQMDLASAADIVSNVLTGYGLEVEELTRVNDVLVKTFTSANTDLMQLGEAMEYVGPLASSVGMQFEQAAAAVGLLGNAGIQASSAGTALRGIITKLLSPSAAAESAMEQLGISVLDAEGNMRGLDHIIEDFQHAFGDVAGAVLDAEGNVLEMDDAVQALMGTGEKGALLMEIFGQRAGPAMAALISQGSGALRELTGELEDSAGTASEIADAQMQGLNGAMKELKSAFEGLQIAIAESGLLEMVTNFAKGMADWLRRMAQTNPETLRWITIIGAATAALGPLIFIIGTTVSAFGGILRAMALVMKAGPLFITTAKSIGAAVALMGGPITLIVTALAGLAAAWVMYGDEIREYVNGWIQRIDEAMGGRLVPIIDFVKELFRGLVDTLGQILRGLWQLITGDFTGAWETFREIFTDAWNGIVEVVQNAANAIWEWITGTLGDAFDWLGDKISTVTGWFGGLYDAVVGNSFIPDMVDEIIAEFKRLEDGFVQPAEDGAGKVGDSFQSLGDRVGGIFRELAQTGTVSMRSLIQLAATLVSKMFGIEDIWTNSQGGGGSLGDVAGSIFGAAFGGGLATGGLAMAGRPYVVGERRAELFVPHTTGTVEPDARGGGVTQVFNIQTPDANSFRRSERQILRGARQRLQTV